ncbi:hypothetical protein NPIL_112661, partial [Nephila pilipes]
MRDTARWRNGKQACCAATSTVAKSQNTNFA